MNPEKKIFVFIDWYLPGYKAGGPIQSCANLVAHLKNVFDFSVVTGDTDLFDATPYAGITSNAWNILPSGTKVYYFSQNRKTYRNIRSFMLREKFDVLYLNSFFSIPFTIFPLLIVRLNHMSCKVIVAPRGMMGKGSLGMKPLKKKLFIYAVKLTGLFKGVTWHASTSGEVDEIETVFGKNVVIKKAINLTAPRQIVRKSRYKEKGTVSFFCLARISPVKNILAIFRYLQLTDPADKVTIHLYGDLEDEPYVLQCKMLAGLCTPNIDVEFKGPLENSKVQQMAEAYHFMILPTLNENFGHAIVESLMAGCPVLISDKTPWKNLEEIKAGWDLPLTHDLEFVQKMHFCAQMDQHTYNQWSEGAYQLAEKILQNQDATKQNTQLFI